MTSVEVAELAGAGGLAGGVLGAVILLDELAEQASPHLAHTSPDRADLPGSSGHPGPRAGRGAIAEAHDAALLGTLINHANYSSQAPWPD